MSKLKPCPFCGEIPKIDYGCEYIDDIAKYWIQCNNEKCRIRPCTDMHVYKFVVVREWNRRKDGEQK